MKNRILPLAALLMCLALVLSAVSAWAEAAGTPLLTRCVFAQRPLLRDALRPERLCVPEPGRNAPHDGA